MRLGIDASRANRRQRTGVEQYAYHLIQELKNIIPTDVEVVLYVDRPLVDDLAKLPSNWSAKILLWPPKFLWTHLRLSWELWRWPVDGLFVPAHVIPFYHPAKTAMTIHDVAFYYWPQSYSAWENFYQRLAIKQAKKFAQVIFTPSGSTKNDLSKLFGFRAEQITVTNLALPHSQNHKAEPVDLSILGITKPYLLFVGRLEEKKNLLNLIKAFDQTVANGQLVLVGKPGFGHQAIYQAIRRAAKASDIIVPNWLEDHILNNLYQHAQAVILPSWYEGFGLPVLEAWAAGKPILASDHSSLQEIIGSAGLLFKPEAVGDMAKNIDLIFQDQQLADRLASAGQQQLRKFSWTTSAQLTWQELQKMLYS